MLQLSFSLLSIALLYLLVAWFKPAISQRLPQLKVCAICYAVSLTWLALLGLFLTHSSIDPLLIAILMGQSVVGLMYQLEKWFGQQRWPGFYLVRLWLILGGIAFTYLLLIRNWPWFWLATSVSFVLGILLIFYLTSLAAKPDDKNPSAWRNRLDNCC